MAAPRKSAGTPGPSSEIPDKLYFKIGEVAELVGVQPHVLRYWEKEIPFIKPGKTASNQRRYRRRDVEIFREIRRLLHEERYTLAGARRRVMSGERGKESSQAPHDPPHAPAVAAAETRPATPSQAHPSGAGEPRAAAVTAPASAAAAAEPKPGAAPSSVPPPGREQLDLGFASGSDEERLSRLRAGLRELIRLSGEEP